MEIMEDKLTQYIFLLTKLLHKNIHPILKQLYTTLTHNEFKILIFLKDKNYSMKEIGQKLGISKQQLSQIIEHLVDKKYVERIIDSNDRRYINIIITKEGKECIEQTYQQASKIFSKKFSSLDKNQQEQFFQSVETIQDIFDKIQK